MGLSKQESNKKWRAKNQIKMKAERIASRYVSLAPSCADCGSKDRLERHHINYLEPLNVVTLCKNCHEMRHSKGESGEPPEGYLELRYDHGIYPVVIIKRGNLANHRKIDVLVRRVADNIEYITHPRALWSFPKTQRPI